MMKVKISQHLSAKQIIDPGSGKRMTKVRFSSKIRVFDGLASRPRTCLNLLDFPRAEVIMLYYPRQQESDLLYSISENHSGANTVKNLHVHLLLCKAESQVLHLVCIQSKLLKSTKDMRLYRSILILGCLWTPLGIFSKSSVFCRKAIHPHNVLDALWIGSPPSWL